MSNKFKDIDIKKHIYYFLHDIISTKIFDRNKIKEDEKSYKNFFIYYIRFVTIKILKYIKIDSVNPLYHIIHKGNRYFEDINKNRNLTLVPTNESKEMITKYE